MLTSGETISTGRFFDALRKLNPKFKVCSFDNSNRLAGLYIINKRGEWEDICGVDKQFVPTYATFDDGGHVVKSGWRRVFWILLGNNYVTRRQLQKVCPGFFDSRAYTTDRFTGGVQGDAIDNKVLRYMSENNNGDPFGCELLTNDQILDVAKDIQAKDSEQLRQEREHDKWFLERWKQQGGGVNDRPNY